MFGNTVFHGDCLELFHFVPDHSQHLVLADPPYNIGKNFGNDSDRMSYGDFVIFSQEWLTEALRVLAPTGTLMVYGVTKINWFLWGLLRDHSADPDKQLRELIWHYTNKQVPALKFYQPAHENIIVFCKDPAHRTFNLDDLRQPYESNYSRSAGRLRRSSPGRFGSRPSVYRAHPKGAAPRDVIVLDDDIPPVRNGGVLKTGTLAGGAGRERAVGLDGTKHPTQKPLKLTRWLILGSSDPGDNVLIPFVGSGTEALVAYKEERNFLGFELNANYVEMARTRFVDAGYLTEYLQLGETLAWRAVGQSESFEEQDAQCRKIVRSQN